ncbi:hypothetical protein FB45DRAFT_298983 [Roridomyces roridus]|uniref:Uncharacterized protein n=1 Tax=Roridomyces roridus TaxID=1738132 RepID=A0AAD7CEA7_9AGAR|nr:hypothetical protein FB45DRAFT_298983 [Roridomyces roridus]
MAASSRHLCLPSPCRKVCGAKHQPPFLSHYLPRAYLDPAKCRPRHQPRQCPSMSPRRPTSPRVVRPQREADACSSYHAIRSEAHIRRQRAASLPKRVGTTVSRPARSSLSPSPAPRPFRPPPGAPPPCFASSLLLLSPSHLDARPHYPNGRTTCKCIMDSYCTAVLQSCRWKRGVGRS